MGRSASACGDEQEWSAKLGALRQALSRHESLVVAYSGGVDSSVLLAAARDVLGARASAVIADSASLPRRELESALAFARSIGVEPVVARTEELSDERYAANAGDRCYWCKSALFEAMGAWAARALLLSGSRRRRRPPSPRPRRSRRCQSARRQSRRRRDRRRSGTAASRRTVWRWRLGRWASEGERPAP